jgi:hypothetical protein
MEVPGSHTTVFNSQQIHNVNILNSKIHSRRFSHEILHVRRRRRRRRRR